MNANGHLIELLAQSEIMKQYEQAFTETTGMPLALRSMESWKLPLHGKRKESPFCAWMAKKSRTCSSCLQTQEQLAQAAIDKPCSLTCAYGLLEMAVPIRVGSETIGFLQTGQVRSEKPTVEVFQQIAAGSKTRGIDLHGPEPMAAFLETPVISGERLESAKNLLRIFADHLSMKATQIAIQEQNAENPVITKAKHFIQDHHSEDLTLGQVAAAVHTSVFYFCKLFKQSTGITFTEFVSQTRVDHAKNLLLNPNLHVSEIAYEVGFQSLTHFNRIFKKLVGKSPTQYRAHLPKFRADSSSVGGKAESKPFSKTKEAPTEVRRRPQTSSALAEM